MNRRSRKSICPESLAKTVPKNRKMWVSWFNITFKLCSCQRRLASASDGKYIKFYISFRNGKYAKPHSILSWDFLSYLRKTILITSGNLWVSLSDDELFNDENFTLLLLFDSFESRPFQIFFRKKKFFADSWISWDMWIFLPSFTFPKGHI